MRRIAIAGLVLIAAVACSKSTAPVQADVSQLQLDAVNPTNLTFTATNGFPTEPFHVAVGPTTSNVEAARAAFPDSLKLTTSQLCAIAALRTTFEAANKADLLALNAIHEQATAAKKAGKRVIVDPKSANLAIYRGARVKLDPSSEAWVAAGATTI